MAGAIMMFGTFWLLHAMIGGAPAIVAAIAGQNGKWRWAGGALVVAPLWALVMMQGVWPSGGASSFLTRLILLTIVVFVAELLLVLPTARSGSVWHGLLLLGLAIASVVPIQLAVPSLPD
jgi:hypothetical protein